MRGHIRSHLRLRGKGSRLAVGAALVSLAAGSMWGAGALFAASPAVTHGHGSAHAPSVNKNTIRDEGKWFQLSHFDNKTPSANARIKAMAAAKKLPLSPIGGSYHTGSVANGAATSGTTPGVWQPLGPQPIDTGAPPNGFGLVSGRVTAEAVNPTNPNDVWVGTADGGVWNSTDGGQHWQAMTDTQATLSTGAIAVDPNNSNTIYVGTGEGNFNGDAYWGAGILKSTDHGATWTQEGFSDFGGMGFTKIAVDPSNSNDILAAVTFDGGTAPTGGSSNVNTQEGIWQSTNGGTSWTNVLGSGVDFEGGTDLAFDPANPAIVFAGVGDVFGQSGPQTANGGVYESTDHGAAWTQVTTSSLPTGANVERTSVGISKDGTHVYAVFTDGGLSACSPTPCSNFGNILNSTIYVSTDTGATWTAKSISSYTGFANDNGEQQWWYDSYAAVDPNNSSTAYVGGVDIWKTTDGGTTWTNATDSYNTGATHPDQHALAFFGPSSSSFYFGNDGGVWSSTNGLSTTNDLNGGGLNITQFYGGSIGEVGSGAQIYGGAQDNGTNQYPAGASYHTPQTWNEVFGGDGFYTAVDYTNNLNVYEEYYDLNINKSTDGGTTWNPATTGINASDPVNFSAPFVESPNHPNTLIAGTDKVYVTTNGASTWTATNGGNPLDGTSAISALAFAQSDGTDQTLYAGDNSGNVFVTTNGGTSWTMVTPVTAPLTMVTGVAVDPTNAQTVYASYNSFTGGGAHIFKSTDSGAHWSDISTALPDIPFESVLVSPNNSNLIIAGSDVGIFDSPDGGATWYQLGTQLPNVAVDQIFMNHSGTKLFVATHGRGMWELPMLSNQWYFAEGYTGGSFTEYLTLENPNNTATTVSVNYLIQGASSVSKTYIVNANARRTVNVNTEIGTGKSVSMVVSGSQPIVAERPMYFTYSSSVLTQAVPGGSDVLGATSLGTNFNFGYVDTTANHDTYFSILNQNSSQMTATITYRPAAGGTATVTTHTIPANSRGTVKVTQSEGLAPGTYSASVVLSAAGLVERPMYLIDGTTNFTGSADVIGVQQPLTSWSFAEGFTGNSSNTFDERYILSNPSTTQSAHATVTFYETTGTVKTQNVTLAAGTQQVVDADSVLGPGVNNSATVTSDQPILAERFQTFTYNSIPGATDVLGTDSPGDQFYFAEGFTGNPNSTFSEYLTVENPNATAATITVTFLPTNGAAPTVYTHVVQANSRYTLNTNTVMPSQSFSMVVSSTLPVVAERPMYFNYNNSGQTGGSDVVGYQP